MATAASHPCTVIEALARHYPGRSVYLDAVRRDGSARSLIVPAWLAPSGAAVVAADDATKG